MSGTLSNNVLISAYRSPSRFNLAVSSPSRFNLAVSSFYAFCFILMCHDKSVGQLIIYMYNVGDIDLNA